MIIIRSEQFMCHILMQVQWQHEHACHLFAQSDLAAMVQAIHGTAATEVTHDTRSLHDNGNLGLSAIVTIMLS